MAASLFSRLKIDHNEIKKGLRQLDKLGIKEKILFEQLRIMIIAHMKAEEQVIYRPLERAANENAREIGFESEIEHEIAEDLLDRMVDDGMGEERWNALLYVLIRTLNSHIKHEEAELFAQAKKIFGKHELKDMAAEFAAKRERFLHGKAPKPIQESFIRLGDQPPPSSRH